MRGHWLFAVAGLAALAGCGGGGAGGGGAAPSRSKAEARFDVDLKAGKVTISSADGRAVFQGGAVSFASSDVLTVSGDAGKRLVRISARNQSGETWGASPVNLIVSDVVRADAAALRAGVSVSRYAGNGSTMESDGYRTGAGLGNFGGLCAGSGPLAGSLVLSSYYTVRRLGADGMVGPLAGLSSNPGFADGTGAAARFAGAYSVASDGAGIVYAVDFDNRRVRRITPQGEVTTIAGTGAAGAFNSTGDLATFTYPLGVAVSSDGDRIYVSDGNHTIRLIRYRGSGRREQAVNYEVTTVAGAAGISGLVDGAAPSARLNQPYGLTLMTDGSGVETLFVADATNCAIRRISTPGGAATVTTVAGDGVNGDADGAGGVARLRYPHGIAGQWLDSTSFVLYVSDAHRIRVIRYLAGGSPTQKGSYLVATLAGSSSAGVADGDGNTAGFWSPNGIVAFSAGPGATLYVADSSNMAVRKVTVPGGALHSGGAASWVSEPVRMVNWDAELPARTAWRRAMSGSGVDWTVDVQFYIPEGVTGFSFLATVETDSNLVNVPASGASTVSTLAGCGLPGSTDGLGATARFGGPRGVVAVPPAMRPLYRSASGAPIRAFIVDAQNDRVRFLDTAGYLGVWAGSSYGFADGVGSAARFAGPADIALHPDGSLIVSEALGNHIRRIWPNQQVTTIAGAGQPGSDDGPGSSATFRRPLGVAVNSGGRIFVADTGNHTIRQIILTGSDPRAASSYTVATPAGSPGVSGFIIGSGSVARFNSPSGIIVDGAGRLLVADRGNQAIRSCVFADDTSLICGVLATGLTDPVGLALDTARNLYITHVGAAGIGPAGSTVVRCGLDGGGIALVAGGGSSGYSDGANASFTAPCGIAVESTGTLLVTDTDTNTLRAVSRIIDTAVQ